VGESRGEGCLGRREAPDGCDREVKLEPPVNQILPVSRGAEASLWKAFEASWARYRPRPAQVRPLQSWGRRSVSQVPGTFTVGS
jgi:hypothetical protein